MTHADPLDQASELELQQLQVAMANRPLPKPFSAICLNGDCGTASLPKSNYCCPECREDAEKHERAARFKRH
ncbi:MULTISPECIES: hypothetical protein [unclassified Tatumella]|uniref:hypothetical protein n=1 Tax=unclassified Tatumella TaxID=2649542 RepID=UPI001BB04D6D|nr:MULTISPECIES: hypothetical protein [unclassified Tatumella]MBS0856710.1 hypothetical protein [Tatumella sp. JGM16]MBS0912924.1 hypothetical protein [Tatumella sp. JGM91]